jgi:hypothetical protein
MLNVFLKEVKRRREDIDKPDQRALLILDGHSSRLQLNLWKKFFEVMVYVLVLPSHTSQITQPLDRTVNYHFKCLLQSIKGLPAKKNDN